MNPEFECSAQYYARYWPATDRLWSVIERSTLVPVSGTGVWFAYPDGGRIHLLQLLPCLNGWTPKTVRSKYAMAGAAFEDDPVVEPAYQAMHAQAKTHKTRLGAIDSLNVEKKHTAAERKMMVRQIAREGERLYQQGGDGMMDIALLRRVIWYQPETGLLIWPPRTPDLFEDGARHSAETKCKRWNKMYAFRLAFSYSDDNGYLVGTVFSKAAEARYDFDPMHGRSNSARAGRWLH